MLGSKLRFHCRVDCGHFQALRMLGLIGFWAYRLYNIIYLLLIVLIVSYSACFRSELEYAPVISNNLTLSDSKIKNIQRKFASFCYIFF
jgi:hypothetical protein